MILNPSITINNGTLLNRSCKVNFGVSKSMWGAYNSANRTKGYRVSLIINNKTITYSDSLIPFSASTNVNKTFSLSDLINNKNVSTQYGDTIQIGIQTWVKDQYGNLILSDQGTACSAPIYLKHSLTVIDKIHLKTISGFHRVLVYMPHFNG
jgi:hypothetical protein